MTMHNKKKNENYFFLLSYSQHLPHSILIRQYCSFLILMDKIAKQEKDKPEKDKPEKDKQEKDKKMRDDILKILAERYYEAAAEEEMEKRRQRSLAIPKKNKGVKSHNTGINSL